jgi:hypothetical protein
MLLGRPCKTLLSASSSWADVRTTGEIGELRQRRLVELL